VATRFQNFPVANVMIRLNAATASMKKCVRQNPVVTWPAIILSCVGTAMFFLIPSLGNDLQVWGSFVLIAGLLLQHTGTELILTDEGIKFGFTKISWSSIDHIDLDSVAQIVIITRIGVRRNYALTRWHYHPADWDLVRERLRTIESA
jgi:hypothetical protein